MKIDATRRDERRPCWRRDRIPPRCAQRKSERGHRDAVRIVGVDDVGIQPVDDARELPAGVEIHLHSRRERNEVEPLGSAPPQLAVRVRDERGTLADFAQAVHRQQHLVLPAAPRSGRIDVEGEHQNFVSLRGFRVFVIGALIVRAPTIWRTSGTRSTRSSPR